MKETAGETVRRCFGAGVCVKDLLFSFGVFVFFEHIDIVDIISIHHS